MVKILKCPQEGEEAAYLDSHFQLFIPLWILVVCFGRRFDDPVRLLPYCKEEMFVSDEAVIVENWVIAKVNMEARSSTERRHPPPIWRNFVGLKKDSSQ